VGRSAVQGHSLSEHGSESGPWAGDDSATRGLGNPCSVLGLILGCIPWWIRPQW
jgi:hypothetical protein